MALFGARAASLLTSRLAGIVHLRPWAVVATAGAGMLSVRRLCEAEEVSTGREGRESEKGSNDANNDGWVTLPTGLQYCDVITGYGDVAKAGDILRVQYTGSLSDGTIFFRSQNELTVQLGERELIAGLEEGLRGMQQGGRRKLTIPPKLGYGSIERSTIPPNSTLHYDVTLKLVETRYSRIMWFLLGAPIPFIVVWTLDGL